MQRFLRFQTEHIGICTRCVGSLNKSPEAAKNAEARLTEKLARGMQRNAERDLHSDEEWKRRRAQRILDDLDSAVAAALHDWITNLLKNPENSTRDFKVMRAYRRRLLRLDGYASYPGDWGDVARRIRQRDGYKCTVCGATDTILDVHHIVYLSNHGTNQQSNLVTLCRKCHEIEHEREFDWHEARDPESISPISPPQDFCAHASALSPTPSPERVTHKPLWEPPLVVSQPATPTVHTTPSKQPPLDLVCPRCSEKLIAHLTTAVLESQRVRCPSCTLVFSASDGLDHWVIRSRLQKISSQAEGGGASINMLQLNGNTFPALPKPPAASLKQKKRISVRLWQMDSLVLLVLLVFIVFIAIASHFRL